MATYFRAHTSRNCVVLYPMLTPRNRVVLYPMLTCASAYGHHAPQRPIHELIAIIEPVRDCFLAGDNAAVSPL